MIASLLKSKPNHMVTVFIGLDEQGSRHDERVYNGNEPLSPRMIKSIRDSILELDLVTCVKIETVWMKGK